jgi:hypothetical protein
MTTVFITSNYMANVPMEVSATAFVDAATPGPEYSQTDLRLVGFSAPYTVVTPEPSSLLLACIGMGLLVGWKAQKNFAGELRQGAR